MITPIPRSVAWVAVVAAIGSLSCGRPPTREGPTRKDETPGDGARARTPVGDLDGDFSIRYARATGTGKRVVFDIGRESGEKAVEVESVWLKSDLMPTRTWVVEMEDGLFERLLDRIEGAGMPGEPPVDDGMAPYCSLDVRVGDARWGDGGPCADLPAEFAPLWNDVTVMLHPQWFAARHLLEAGRDAESKMDAGDVFHYYDDGLGVLGADYGIAESETGKQIVEARESQAAGEHVDAVVLARNALASRLAFYRKERLVGLAVSDPDGSR